MQPSYIVSHAGVTMNSAYIRCRVLPGMFDSELYVMINGSAAYVNRDNVKVYSAPETGTEGRGAVFVYVIEAKHDRLLVELPGEPIVGGLRTWVPAAQQVSA